MHGPDTQSDGARNLVNADPLLQQFSRFCFELEDFLTAYQ
jgi:hypothetical protein